MRILDILDVKEKFLKFADNHNNNKFIDNQLIWLDLGCLGIESLPPDIFEGLSHLEYLGLYGNDITTLDVSVFAPLQSLRFLDLGNNNLSELPAGIFDSLQYLEKVWLYENLLSTVNHLFSHNSELNELNLNSNNLSELPVITYLPKLERLELALNPSLEVLPPEYYAELPNLRAVIFDEVVDGSQMIINVLNAPEIFSISSVSENHYVLVTGLMGCGKSTLLKYFPLPKVAPVSPPIQEDIYFDHIVATTDSKGHVVNFFELDGPTILTWTKFIELAEVIIHIVNPDTSTTPDRAMQLISHIETYLKPAHTQLLVINKYTHSLHIEKIIASIQSEYPTMPIFKLSVGRKIPTLGGLKKTILNIAEVKSIISATLDFIID